MDEENLLYPTTHTQIIILGLVECAYTFGSETHSPKRTHLECILHTADLVDDIPSL